MAEGADDSAGEGEAVVVEATEFAVPEKSPMTYVTEQFIVATGERSGALDWDVVEAVVERADGMPAMVGEGAPVVADDLEDGADVSLNSTAAEPAFHD